MGFPTAPTDLPLPDNNFEELRNLLKNICERVAVLNDMFSKEDFSYLGTVIGAFPCLSRKSSHTRMRASRKIRIDNAWRCVAVIMKKYLKREITVKEVRLEWKNGKKRERKEKRESEKQKREMEKRELEKQKREMEKRESERQKREMETKREIEDFWKLFDDFSN